MSETSNRSSSTTRHDDVCAIRKLSEAWVAAVRAKDLERLLSMITDDAVFLCASIGTIRGKDMVAAIYRDTFAKYDIDQTFVIEEIEVMGDRAYVWGSDAITVTPLGGGAPVQRRGYGLAILQLQQDGSWRYRRGLNNMVQVSPAAEPQS